MEKYTLKEQDYLDLWKFFSEDTAKIKDKIWTIASWLYALMSGLLAFLFDKKAAGWHSFICLVGIFLSIYTGYMIYEYGRHIKGGWRTTDFLVKQIKGMQEVWDSRKSDADKNPKDESKSWLVALLKILCIKDVENNLPPFAQRLLLLAVGYAVIFAGLGIYFFTR